MARPNAPRVTVALLGLVLLGGVCTEDDPTTELPCEFYETAPPDVEVPPECRPVTTTTVPLGPTRGAPGY